MVVGNSISNTFKASLLLQFEHAAPTVYMQAHQDLYFTVICGKG